MLRRASLHLLALGATAAAAGPGLASATPPTSSNPLVEAQNYSITLQRQTIYEYPGSYSYAAIDTSPDRP